IENKVLKSSTNWVLLVDDNLQVAGFYQRIAEALGLKYQTADSFQGAVDIISRHGRPRLVITDIQLSNSSGLDLVEYLRKTYDQSLPIIVISGNENNEIEQKVYDSGASKYLRKPLGRRKLFSEIEDLLTVH